MPGWRGGTHKWFNLKSNRTSVPFWHETTFTCSRGKEEPARGSSERFRGPLTGHTRRNFPLRFRVVPGIRRFMDIPHGYPSTCRTGWERRFSPKRQGLFNFLISLCKFVVLCQNSMVCLPIPFFPIKDNLLNSQYIDNPFPLARVMLSRAGRKTLDWDFSESKRQPYSRPSDNWTTQCLFLLRW